MCNPIEGKIAFVTGGFGGIGLACAKALLCNGAKGVMIVDIDPPRGKKVSEELNQHFGENKVAYMQVDCTKKEQMADAFKKCISMFKGLDIVVNNAGMLRDAHWEEMIALNVGGVVQGSLLGIEHMGKNNGGKGGIIINIASILGLQGLSGCPVYTATKHFIVGFDRSFGSEYWYSLTGIRFLTVCPGVTDTAMVDEAGDYTFKGFPGLGELLVKQLGSMPKQKVECVGEVMVKAINQGENGSIWVTENSWPGYEVVIPDRLKMKRC